MEHRKTKSKMINWEDGPGFISTRQISSDIMMRKIVDSMTLGVIRNENYRQIRL
jgi:hypothetical protein